MQLFVFFLAGVVSFVSLDVGVAEESSPVLVPSDQHPCSLDRVCEVVDTILQRQDILEKKVKENSKLFGARPCTEGEIFGDFRSSQFFPNNLTFCGLFQICKISNCCSNLSGWSLTLD